MATWTVLPGFQRSAQSVQTPTDSPPSDPKDGVQVDDVAAVVPILTAPQGETFIGSGSIRGYYWSDTLQRWVPAPRADDDLADLKGLDEGALPAIPITSGHGRFAWICDGVGLSGGAQITLTIECASVRGGAAI